MGRCGFTDTSALKFYKSADLRHGACTYVTLGIAALRIWIAK